MRVYFRIFSAITSAFFFGVFVVEFGFSNDGLALIVNRGYN